MGDFIMDILERMVGYHHMLNQIDDILIEQKIKSTSGIWGSRL
jgi:hypothetical protein